MANDLTKVVALADLGEAVLSLIKESGLMKPKRRRRAAAKVAKAPSKPKASKRPKVQPRGQGVLGQVEEE